MSASQNKHTEQANTHELAVRIGLDHSGLYTGADQATMATVDYDPKTAGAVGLFPYACFDAMGGLESIQLIYWFRRPNSGVMEKKYLFEVATQPESQAEDPQNVEEIYFLGKPLLEDLPPDLRVQRRELYLNIIQELILNLRDGHSPKETARILHECGFTGISGEEIALPGLNLDGSFNFRLSEHFKNVCQPITIQGPAGIAEALIGQAANSFAPETNILGRRAAFGTDIMNGVTFRAETQSLCDSANGTIGLRAKIKPHVIPAGFSAQSIDPLYDVAWAGDGRDQEGFPRYALSRLNLKGHDLLQADQATQWRALAIINKLHTKFRKFRYPQGAELFAEFRMLDFLEDEVPPGPDGEATLISMLGNGKDEIIEDFGGGLGAMKVLRDRRLNDDNKVDICNIILDAGILLPPKGSDWDAALPDIAAHLKDTRAIFITHRHLDHMDGLVFLAQLGLLRGKDIHCSPRVARAFSRKLKKEVKDSLMRPMIRDLKDREGTIEVKDDRGRIRWEVEYCREGMDHSTPSTIFRAVNRFEGRNENFKFSYLFYGDGRRPTKRGAEFLQRGLRSLGLERQDTFMDIDSTNLHKPGHASTEQEVEDNLTVLLSAPIFQDKVIVNALISTNDGRLGSMMRIFNRLGRNFTGVGANIEDSLTDHNILGSDTETDPSEPRGNINKQLKDHAVQNGLNHDGVEYAGRNSGKAQKWRSGDLGRLGILVTGTQNSEAEHYSQSSRAADNWSLLDTNMGDRSTGYALPQTPDSWIYVLDQQAIPGNESEQFEMVQKLLRKQSVKCVVVAIEGGYKCYGLDYDEMKVLQDHLAGKTGDFDCDPDFQILTVANMTIHASGHGHEKDKEEVIRIAQPEMANSTHTNQDHNTYILGGICDKLNVSHPGERFDDGARLKILAAKESGEPPQLRQTGQERPGLILLKVVREMGEFFAGSLRAKRKIVLDGKSGTESDPLRPGNGQIRTFEEYMPTTSLQKTGEGPVRKKRVPFNAQTTPPRDERRVQGPCRPFAPRLTTGLRDSLARSVARKIKTFEAT